MQTSQDFEKHRLQMEIYSAKKNARTLRNLGYKRWAAREKQAAGRAEEQYAAFQAKEGR